MCYNLPVLSEILRDNESRALYLFPTKALSSDQVAELYEIIKAMERAHKGVYVRRRHAGLRAASQSVRRGTSS